MNPEMESGVITCGNCRSPMPRELRFCRNCGFRLGEGVAEYTETVRFQNAPPGTIPGNNPAGSMPCSFAGPPALASCAKIGKRRRRISGMGWMFIGLLIFFIAAAGLTAIVRQVKNVQGPIRVAINAPRSFVGVDDFKTAEGGVTFDNVEPPGGPADKAGLIGGDLVTTIDGQPIRSDDEVSDVLRRMPVGKTVDVVYIRDGETKTTKLTTISQEEMGRLNDIYEEAEHGQFGYDDDDAEQVEIPNSPMHGVKLGRILSNRPADLAGVQSGDVVIQFGETPIRTPGEFLMRVRRAAPYSTVKMIIIRNGEKMEIPVKMGKQ